MALHFNLHKYQTETQPFPAQTRAGNVLSVSVRSTLNLRAYIGYMPKGKKHKEFLEIFIENREYVFKTFLPPDAAELVCITAENLEAKNGHLIIDGIGFESKKLPEGGGEVFLENDSVRIGIRLSWGGGLASLVCLDKGVEQVFSKKSGRMEIGAGYSARPGCELFSRDVNLLNNYDTGRLLQQSYYGASKAPYKRGSFWGNLWRYNPVQGGDKFNNPSRLVDFEIGGGGVYVKSRPLEWDKENSCTDSYMESRYSLIGRTVRIENRFIDFSNFDHYASGTSDQELPALYVAAPLRKFVYKKDGKPVARCDLKFWGDIDNAIYQVFTVEDYWSAWVNEDNFGVGLFVPGVSKHMSGVYAAPDEEKLPADKSNSVNYTAALGQFAIPNLAPVEYECFLHVGGLKEMQAAFGELKKTHVNTLLRNLLAV
ncbi:MAG: hypothetical protein LBL66_06525 [Clostridiales bacterium]|nr:hypothetical protein [Clostridiales bacterium]